MRCRYGSSGFGRVAIALFRSGLAIFDAPYVVRPGGLASCGRGMLMSTGNRDERLARRLADLYATDQQFADARPNEEITAAINQPGLQMPELVRTVMEGYADRPALGQRA